MTKGLNIWLIKIGEPLPIDPGVHRPYRISMVADELTSRGHNVTWWTCSFDHITGTQRIPGSFVADRPTGPYRIVVIKSPGYKHGSSFGRLADHALVAKRFRVMATQERRRPDVIVSCLPTLELCDATRHLAKIWGVPYVVDIRDVWPDIFQQRIPKGIGRLGSIALYPYRRMAKRSCHEATGLIGITASMLAWGVTQANRTSRLNDAVIPLGYPINNPPIPDRVPDEFWPTIGIEPEHICATFLGTLSAQFDFDPIFAAASKLEIAYPKLRIVLCGKGLALPRIQELAAQTNNVIVPGFLDTDQMQYLLSHTVIGLAPYNPDFNFGMSLPNKVPEYLSAGLPILTSMVNSEVSRLLASNDCGGTYEVAGEDSFFEAVSVILSANEARRDQMRNNSRTLFNSRFRSDVVYQTYATYVEAIGLGTPASQSD